MGSPAKLVKKCTTCQKPVPISSFLLTTGTELSQCRPCRLEYKRQYRRSKGQKSLDEIRAEARRLDGDRLCTRCKTMKPCIDFISGKSKSPWCHECRVSYQRENARRKGVKIKNLSAIVDGMKKCGICQKFIDLSCFSPCSRGLGSVSYACRECAARKQREDDTAVVKRRQYMRELRALHPDEWRASHREYMLLRRQRMEMQSDGTVTLTFIRKIYSLKRCYYCDSKVYPLDRTVDHMTPICRGGKHSMDNIVMACYKCNAKKGTLTAEEYMRRRACQ
jgi:5-methylcytosine-specific restriction endonuclease McrA